MIEEDEWSYHLARVTGQQSSYFETAKIFRVGFEQSESRHKI